MTYVLPRFRLFVLILGRGSNWFEVLALLLKKRDVPSESPIESCGLKGLGAEKMSLGVI